MEADEAIGRCSSQQPEITVGTDESRVIDEAIDALSSRWITSIARRKSRPGSPRDRGPAWNRPTQRLTANYADASCSNQGATCRRSGVVWPADDGEGERIHPPDWAVKAVDVRGQWRGIRRLEAIVESPILPADGSVLQTAGYDEATGIIFHPEGEFPMIPERPSRADAVHARDSLLEVVEDFPFSTDAHKAAWLASVLTPSARYAHPGPPPLFLIDANVPGCGKTLATDTTSIIVTGREIARMSLPRDDDETETYHRIGRGGRTAHLDRQHRWHVRKSES